MRCLYLVLVPLTLVASGCEVPLNTKKPGGASSSSGVRRSPAGGAAGTVGAESAGAVGGAAVLRVNGEEADAGQFWRERFSEIAAKAETLSPEAYRMFVERRAAEWISDKVAEMLLYQRAALRMRSAMEKQIDHFVDGEVRRVVSRDYEGVQRRFEKYLLQHGLTVDDFRARLRREIIVTQYVEAELRSRVAEPTRAELYEAYTKLADSLRKPERKRMSLIEVAVAQFLPPGSDRGSDAEATARAAARAQIAAAREALRGGAAFADAARQYSQDSRAEDGGAWGWVGLGTVRERYEPAVAALYSLAAGQTSEIIETPDAYFIVRCDEVEAGFTASFSEVQGELLERYTRGRLNELIAEEVNELRAKARVEPSRLEEYHAAVVQETLRRRPAGST